MIGRSKRSVPNTIWVRTTRAQTHHWMVFSFRIIAKWSTQANHSPKVLLEGWPWFILQINPPQDGHYNVFMYLWWEEQPQTQFSSLVNTKHITKAAALVVINLVSILLEFQRLLLLPYAKPELLKNRMLIYKEKQTPVFHKYFFFSWISHRCTYFYSLNCIREPTLRFLQSHQVHCKH